MRGTNKTGLSEHCGGSITHPQQRHPGPQGAPAPTRVPADAFSLKMLRSRSKSHHSCFSASLGKGRSAAVPQNCVCVGEWHPPPQKSPWKSYPRTQNPIVPVSSAQLGTILLVVGVTPKKPTKRAGLGLSRKTKTHWDGERWGSGCKWPWGTPTCCWSVWWELHVSTRDALGTRETSS